MNFNLIVENLLNDLKPKNGNKAVFVFGRMNPPTLGHEMLIAKAVEIGRAEQRDSYVVLSKTQDNKKNPVSYKDKIAALNAALPKVNFIDRSDIKTIFDAVNFLIKNGYNDLVLVTGSDRAEELTNLFNKYINIEDPEKKLNLVSFRTAVAGDNRDPDSDDASGISATKARNLAKAGDFVAFRKILPTGMPETEAKILFDQIRQNLK